MKQFAVETESDREEKFRGRWGKEKGWRWIGRIPGMPRGKKLTDFLWNFDLFEGRDAFADTVV